MGFVEDIEPEAGVGIILSPFLFPGLDVLGDVGVPVPTPTTCH